jgi:hypothetical protein
MLMSDVRFVFHYYFLIILAGISLIFQDYRYNGSDFLWLSAKLLFLGLV